MRLFNPKRNRVPGRRKAPSISQARRLIRASRSVATIKMGGLAPQGPASAADALPAVPENEGISVLSFEDKPRAVPSTAHHAARPHYDTLARTEASLMARGSSSSTRVPTPGAVCSRTAPPDWLTKP